MDQCLRCGHEMESLQACHTRCANCGAERDCSDI